MLDDEIRQPDNNGWSEWKNHVLLELKKNEVDHASIMVKLDDLAVNKVSQLNQAISALQVRSGVWGLMGGLIPVLIVLVVWYIEKGK